MASTAQVVHPVTSEVIPNRIPVLIPRSMLPDLALMYEAATRGIPARSINRFVSELVVERIAQFRSLRIKPESVLGNLSEEGEAAPQGDQHGHKAAVSPERIQVILHLRFVEHLSVDVIATRFGVGGSTIHRIVESYKSRSHNPSAIVWSPKRTHGDPEA
jgi:hypothetical protein